MAGPLIRVKGTLIKGTPKEVVKGPLKEGTPKEVVILMKMDRKPLMGSCPGFPSGWMADVRVLSENNEHYQL